MFWNLPLGTSNWLASHPNSDRVIVARGPAKSNRKSVGVFLFCDVLIIAKKLMHNRKYISLIVIDIDNTFNVVRTETNVTFRNSCTSCEVDFQTRGNSRMWEQAANRCRNWTSSSIYVGQFTDMCR